MEALSYILVRKHLSVHQQTVVNMSGCSLSRVALTGQCLDEQMASPRRSAFWASWVMASASSSITNLKPFLEDKETALRGYPLVDVDLKESKVHLVVLLENGPGAGKTQNWTTHDIDTSVV